MSKKWFLGFVIFLTSWYACAQPNELPTFNERRLHITRLGMLTLGGWAVGNMVVNGALMANSSGSRYYFHQMNLFWNVINLGLAGLGYYNSAVSDPTGLTLAESLQEQLSMEKLLLFNTGLDVAYITGGFYLIERSRRNNPKAVRWKGYGQALVLQGGFLLIFDALLYVMLHQSGDVLFNFVSQLHPATYGFGLGYRFY